MQFFLHGQVRAYFRTHQAKRVQITPKPEDRTSVFFDYPVQGWGSVALSATDGLVCKHGLSSLFDALHTVLALLVVAMIMGSTSHMVASAGAVIPQKLVVHAGVLCRRRLPEEVWDFNPSFDLSDPWAQRAMQLGKLRSVLRRVDRAAISGGMQGPFRRILCFAQDQSRFS